MQTHYLFIIHSIPLPPPGPPPGPPPSIFPGLPPGKKPPGPPPGLPPYATTPYAPRSPPRVSFAGVGPEEENEPYNPEQGEDALTQEGAAMITFWCLKKT